MGSVSHPKPDFYTLSERSYWWAYDVGYADMMALSNGYIPRNPMGRCPFCVEAYRKAWKYGFNMARSDRYNR